eukprot:12401287-Prorocentrum_lima.AAC.1
MAPRARQSGHREVSQCASAVPLPAKPGGGTQAAPGSGQRPGACSPQRMQIGLPLAIRVVLTVVLLRRTRRPQLGRRHCW